MTLRDEEINRLRNEIIELEKNSMYHPSHPNIRFSIEEGNIINFQYVRGKMREPVGLAFGVWKKYIDLCEEYQKKVRLNKMANFAEMSEEDAKEIQASDADRLNDALMSFETMGKNYNMGLKLAVIKDYSTITTEDSLRMATSPHENEFYHRTREMVIYTIIQNQLQKYRRMISDSNIDNQNFDGVSRKSHGELLALLKGELEKIQSMSPLEFKKYKIEQLQPTTDEKLIIESRYSDVLQEGKSY